MWNKNYLYLILIIVAVAMTAVFLVNKGNKASYSPGILTSPSPTPSTGLGSSATPTPAITSKPVSGPKPTPGIIIQENKTYEQLTEELVKEGRWLVLNSSCTEIVPSNVDYHNNTQIMLDNTASAVRHILKIGGREYLLEAGEWFLTVLSSPVLPAKLPIFCGAMELGQIDLIK